MPEPIIRRVPFVFAVLLLTVMAAPLAYGAVERWAYGGLAAILGALGLLWATHLVFTNGRPAVHPRWIAVPAGLMALVVAWVGLQNSSLLPAGWAHPVWPLVAEALGQEVRATVALTPVDARDTLLRWASYALAFFLALQFGRDRGCARLAYWALVVIAAVYASLALIQQLFGMEQLLWFEAKAGPWGKARQAAPFVNPNNFAAYVGLGAMVALGLIVERLADLRLADRPLREKLRSILEDGLARNWLLLVTLLLLLAGLMFSQSRGGLLAFGLGGLLLLSLIAARRRASWRGFWLLSLAAIGLTILIFAAAFQDLASRFDDIEASDGRLEIYETTLAAITSAPASGYGLGSFEEVYRFYDADPGFRPTRRAHNSYLENALELGLAAALALYLALGWCLARCLIGAWQRRHAAHYPTIGVALSVQMALHSAVDFPLQIPAIALSYFFLLGIALAQSWSSRLDLKRAEI